MANVLLGVTGSVAAIHTPALYEALRQAGHAVKVVATQAALYFFDPAAIASPAAREARAALLTAAAGERGEGERDKDVVILDEDEWPGRQNGQRYQRSDKILHIELRRWAELLAIAPLDANTLAKLANGLSDNCLTCVWRAWDRNRPVLLAPAMNTLMWEHPATARHLRQVAADLEPAPIPEGLLVADLVEWINYRCTKLRVAMPQSKRLACDDIGMGAMAALESIVTTVGQLVNN
jgi:phosphopantothenoylcysteine decarboxylase